MTFSFPVWLRTTALMSLDSFRALELMEKRQNVYLAVSLRVLLIQLQTKLFR